MTEREYHTSDLWAALEELPNAVRENVDPTPSPDAESQRRAVSVIIRQQAIRDIIKRNNLQSDADWTGYDG